MAFSMMGAGDVLGLFNLASLGMAGSLMLGIGRGMIPSRLLCSVSVLWGSWCRRRWWWKLVEL